MFRCPVASEPYKCFCTHDISQHEMIGVMDGAEVHYFGAAAAIPPPALRRRMSKCSLQVTKTPSESTTILNFFLVALIPGMISEWSQQMRSCGTGDETNCEVLEHNSEMRS